MYDFGPMPTDTHRYGMRPAGYVDGDTFKGIIDLGFGLAMGTEGLEYTYPRVRLWGVNTPERRGATLAAGNAARAYTYEWLASRAEGAGDWPFRIHSHHYDAFGRVLAVVWCVATGECLNGDLLRDGYAVEDIRT